MWSRLSSRCWFPMQEEEEEERARNGTWSALGHFENPLCLTTWAHNWDDNGHFEKWGVNKSVHFYSHADDCFNEPAPTKYALTSGHRHSILPLLASNENVDEEFSKVNGPFSSSPLDVRSWWTTTVWSRDKREDDYYISDYEFFGNKYVSHTTEAFRYSIQKYTSDTNEFGHLRFWLNLSIKCRWWTQCLESSQTSWFPIMEIWLTFTNLEILTFSEKGCRKDAASPSSWSVQLFFSLLAPRIHWTMIILIMDSRVLHRYVLCMCVQHEFSIHTHTYHESRHEKVTITSLDYPLELLLHSELLIYCAMSEQLSCSTSRKSKRDGIQEGSRMNTIESRNRWSARFSSSAYAFAESNE